MNYYLFGNFDDKDDNYIIIAKSVKEAENKLAKWIDVEELELSISDVFYLKNATVIK